MNVGDALPSRSVPVRAAAMRTMSDILRDPNPIHLDVAAARGAGLGNRPVNQGPANLSYVIDMLANALPDYRIAGLQCRFLNLVREGDVAEAGGEITAVDGSRLTCSAWLRANGDAALAVTATMVRP